MGDCCMNYFSIIYLLSSLNYRVRSKRRLKRKIDLYCLNPTKDIDVSYVYIGAILMKSDWCKARGVDGVVVGDRIILLFGRWIFEIFEFVMNSKNIAKLGLFS